MHTHVNEHIYGHEHDYLRTTLLGQFFHLIEAGSSLFRLHSIFQESQARASNSPIFTSYITVGVQELQMYATNSPPFTWLLDTEFRWSELGGRHFYSVTHLPSIISYVPQMLVPAFLDGYRQATQHAEYLCRLWLWISSVHSCAPHSSMKIPTGLEWSTPFLAQKSLPGLEVGGPYDLHFTSGNIFYANKCKSVFWGDLSDPPCMRQH